MSWISDSAELESTKTDFVIVTLLAVKGHAPREAGAKMVVTATQTFETIGGGNLEQTAISKARAMLDDPEAQLSTFSLALVPKAGEFGVQCCGGEATVLLERVVQVRPTVAIFGAGHVGKALAKVLHPLPLEVLLIDSRKDQLDAMFKRVDGRVKLEHQPVPEAALTSLPQGSAIIIMTHDHTEDGAILERALRHPHWSYVGLIGSSVKWINLKRELAKHGLTDSDVERVTTPIGIPGIQGKRPEVIAVAVAAQLLLALGL